MGLTKIFRELFCIFAVKETATNKKGVITHETVSLSRSGPGRSSDPLPHPGRLRPQDTATPDIIESVSPTETPEVIGPDQSAEPTESMTVVTPPVETDGAVKPLETQTPVQTQPIQTPSPSEAPVESPSEAPTETSKVQAVWTAISQRELPSFQDLDDDLLSDFYGVDPADLVEYICKIPFMNTQATEFFIAQVQPGQMDTVKAALEARQAALQSQWSQYLPAQLELVENYKLVTSGDYILFAVTEYADDVVNDFNNNVK